MDHSWESIHDALDSLLNVAGQAKLTKADRLECLVVNARLVNDGLEIAS